MRPTITALLLVLLLSVLSTTPTAAQPAEAPAPAHPNAAAAEEAAAAADAAMARGDFPRAAALWERAYAAQPLPEYLFALGQAWEGAPGLLSSARALRAYRRYLREEGHGDPERRARALRAINDLEERRAAEAQGPPEEVIRGVAPAPDYRRPRRAVQPLGLRLERPPAPPPPRRRWMRRVAIALLGGGAALGAIGGGLLAGAVTQNAGSSEADSFSAYLSAQRGARDLFGGGLACLAVGVSAVAGGGVLLALGERGAREGR